VNSLVCFIFISNTICFSFLVHCHLSLTLWRGKCSCALRDRATAVSSRDLVSLPCIERFNSIPVAPFLHQHIVLGNCNPLGSGELLFQVTSDDLLILPSEGSGVLAHPGLIQGLVYGSQGSNESLLLSLHGSHDSPSH
jgi:hypothetical protein